MSVAIPYGTMLGKESVRKRMESEMHEASPSFVTKSCRGMTFTTSTKITVYPKLAVGSVAGNITAALNWCAVSPARFFGPDLPLGFADSHGNNLARGREAFFLTHAKPLNYDSTNSSAHLG